MAELKTTETKKSVTAFLKALPGEGRRKDCSTLIGIMRRVTKAQPRMWGPSIVGFGKYHYVYDSGREGDWFLAGFSPRKQNLTIYVMSGFDDSAGFLAKLGKHKTAKSCLYVNSLSDIRLDVLERLIAHSVARLRKYRR
jgi:hypothetical protein